MNSVSAVKPSQLRTLLAHSIPAKMPVLICSGPGIGKSSIVEQACAEAEADCIVMHPVVSDPTDFKGMPWVGDGGATFLPFGDLQKLVNATKLTACFIDDLGQATPAVQAAAMQLIFGPHHQRASGVRPGRLHRRDQSTDGSRWGFRHLRAGQEPLRDLG